jgi:hypothetical protein
MTTRYETKPFSASSENKEGDWWSTTAKLLWQGLAEFLPLEILGAVGPEKLRGCQLDGEILEAASFGCLQ